MDKIDFIQTVGDERALPVWFVDESDEPIRLTGHVITMVVEANGKGLLEDESVEGRMDIGDCRVYFEIPASIHSIEGTYSHRIVDIDPDSGKPKTIASGSLRYS